MTATAAKPARIGRCLVCETVYRVDAGETIWCGCRDGVPCPLMPWGAPKCGSEGGCTGHPQTFIRFAEIKVTLKAAVTCDGRCWAATGASCVCSCGGDKHGGAHARTI